MNLKAKVSFTKAAPQVFLSEFLEHCRKRKHSFVEHYEINLIFISVLNSFS